MKKTKSKKSKEQYFLGYSYYSADRTLVYLSLTIVALIVLPLTVIISSQDQNLSTHAAGFDDYSVSTPTPIPPAY